MIKSRFSKSVWLLQHHCFVFIISNSTSEILIDKDTMGCVQHSRQPMIEFTANDAEITSNDQQNVVVNRKDSDEEEEEYKTMPREIASQTEDQLFTLNMVTLRVTNEISMLIHRNFTENTSDFLQRKRLGSWWYSAIKNHQYSGIIMQNNIKLTIKYEDDGLSPKQKIENKIECISGLFYTKIDFNDEKLQITFDQSDFEKYINNDIMTENPYYNDDGDSKHVIEYGDINREKGMECKTYKGFEYLDNLDIFERRDRMYEELKIYESEMEHTFIYISDLCTDIKYRQKGIATEIWKKLFNLYDKGTRFGFHVRFDNATAHTVYFKLGFKHVGIVEDYYAKGVHGWKMVLIL